jgi:hypothetical protein
MNASVRRGLPVACAALVLALLFVEASRDRDAVAHDAAPSTRTSSPSPPASMTRPRAIDVHAATRAGSRGTHLGPLPAPNTPLAAILTSLEQQARQGDARAACRVAFELKRCQQTEMRRRVYEAQRARVNAGERSTMNLDRLLTGDKEMNDLEAVCAGITPEKTLEAWDYALAAALAGNREGRWLAAFFPAGLDMMNPENTLEGWAEWRRYIGRILQEGVEAGDPRMFSLSSSAYRMPWFGYRVFERDPVRAAALKLAVRDKASPAWKQGEADAEVLLRGLSPEEQARAKAMVATLPALTGVPAGGIDWSRGMAPDANGSECERP